MGMWFAILRIVIPIAVLIILLAILIPRFKQARGGNSGRIDVEAEVVSSKQPNITDIPKSSTYTPDEAKDNTSK